MRTSGFIELGKERNGQIAVTTSDLLSLNRKYKSERMKKWIDSIMSVISRCQEAQESVYQTSDEVVKGENA